ncbi:MAG: YggT family protein [Sulfuricurvum sp.]|jgi:YggT family protein
MIMEILIKIYLYILSPLLTAYTWIIIIGALLTWVRPDPYNPIVQIIYRLTEPAYRLVRRIMPTVFNGLDIAPIIIILLLKLLEIILEVVFNRLVLL